MPEHDRSVTWHPRSIAIADGVRVAFWEADVPTQPIRLVKDERGVRFALFAFPAGSHRRRFVLVSPRRRGRVTFEWDDRAGRASVPPDWRDPALERATTPAEAAMILQHAFHPIGG